MTITWGAGEPIPEGEDRLDVAAHRELLDRLDLNHPNVMDTAPAIQSLVDEAALRRHYPPEEVDQWLATLDSPAFRFARLTVAEQRSLTHLAAIDAAQSFCADPSTYLDHDGDPDPVSAFYGLGHLSHTRDLPTFALLVLHADVLDLDTRRDLTVFAWRVPEWPHSGLNTDLWHEAWARAGFCSDEDDVTPPTDPITVYRGATPRFKRGLAWTADIDKARWFARRFPKSDTFGQCRVYAADVNPNRVYARIVHRSEDEWVIDTRRLAIRTVEVPRA